MKALLTLGLGLLALAAASRSPLQQRAVDLTLEEFHRQSHVKWMYKEQAVDEVTETKQHTGTFVRLQLSISQTQCSNRPGSRPDCPFKRRPRKLRCLACVKFNFDSPATVLDRHVYCQPERQPVVQETEARHEEKCRAVQQAYVVHHRPSEISTLALVIQDMTFSLEPKPAEHNQH
ncbi:retinoic acid receptor responder protein 2-like [Carettochelys insculpta]|uniref:retinoic acid receptor responder protein 2-like n=1 Tax=Carettochelys insculpta TaxID=44489 RepID=UPI003EBD130B